MTEEEHIARAMLLGMRYHHGNGEPFYYKLTTDMTIDIHSMIDANTLEPFVTHVEPGIDFNGMLKRSKVLAHAGIFTTKRWRL